MEMQTIEQLNKNICKTLKFDYNEFLKMNFDEKNKIIRRYTIEIFKI